ncbi:MAG: UDP-2,3-diacylglucosamine diphosphatase [Rikenellaceae bacterium]
MSTQSSNITTNEQSTQQTNVPSESRWGKKYKTIVISDLHMGSKWSAVEEVCDYLRENSCQKLILCGDIIDGWAIMRGRKGNVWGRKESNFVKLILDLSLDTDIIYLRGNHDDFLDRIIPTSIFNIDIKREYVYTSFGKRYLVTHGDRFDSITTYTSWLSKMGDAAYSMMLWLNKYYNRYRLNRGLPYRSIAAAAKDFTKRMVSRLSSHDKRIIHSAKENWCSGVICGHIHRPEIKMIEDVTYLNSGDWLESLSALTEDWDGNWSLYRDPKREAHLLKVMKR